MSCRTFSHLPLLLAGLSPALALAAGEWPQFRGPNARGLDESRALPTRWNVETGQNICWQTAIPGLAHASPIVWGDYVYVATAAKKGEAELKVGLYGDIAPVEERDQHQWRLLALDETTGKILWNTLAHEGVPKVKRHPKSSHCNSTPATDGRRIVAIFGSEGLFCFDTDGKLLWKKGLGPMDAGFFLARAAQWGFASSAVIHDDKVIVLCDVLTDPFLAVFDLADGRELWRVPRKDVPTWGTPTLVEANGRQQIVVNGWRESGGYDFLTGRNLWKLSGGGDIPVPTPIFALNLIYLTSAHGQCNPIRAIRPTASGDITPPDPAQTNDFIVWAHAHRGNYMQTPIVVGDLLFACFDNGVLTCFDAKTGAIKYSERLTARGEGFSASPVSDGRHLYFASELGNVFVVAASERFVVVANNALRSKCMATPAISHGLLLFRTQDKLIAIGAKD